MTEAAKARWAELSARQRGALIRAVRRGDRVGEADRALAVEVARREIERLARNARPGRVTLVQVVHGVIAAVLALGTAAALAARAWAGAAVYGAGALVFGSSALLARRRLDRRVARLTSALERNAAPDAE